MVSKNGDDAIVKHILRIPPISEEETKNNIHFLDSIRNLIINNQLKFSEAVNKFSDDENSKFNAGNITDRYGSNFITLDNLDKELIIALKKIEPGQFSKPLEFNDDRGRKAVRLIYFKNRTTPHKENLKDDYNKIALRALDIKKNAAIEKWLANKSTDFYLTIQSEYGDCVEIKKFLSK